MAKDLLGQGVALFILVGLAGFVVKYAWPYWKQQNAANRAERREDQEKFLKALQKCNEDRHQDQAEFLKALSAQSTASALTIAAMLAKKDKPR